MSAPPPRINKPTLAWVNRGARISPRRRRRRRSQGEALPNLFDWAARRRLKFEITDDVKIPLTDDDPTMENGWRCIQIPPSADPRWFIYNDAHHRKTKWARVLSDDEEEGE